jgi:beta-lactamase regulating signal transducer with metallopeptidase domain
MTVAIIVYILIVTVPLIAAAALTEKLFRLWSLPVRGAWAITALLIALIGGRTITRQLLAPSGPASISTVRYVESATPITATGVAGVQAFAQELVSLPRTTAAYVAHAIGPASNVPLAILWCVMSIAMLILVSIVYLRVWKARHDWSIVDFSGQRVRVAPHAGPAVIGLFRPEIVVPRWVLDAQLEDSRLIVMHEMEHRAARDPLLLAAVWALVALFPWHPGAWYCLARTRLAIELDCDARVVGHGASLRTYTQLLVNQARLRLGAPMHMWLGATSLLEPSSHLERRLRAMIIPDNAKAARKPLTRYLRTASYIAIVSTIAIAACESHVPTAADISGLDAASAQKEAAGIFNVQKDSGKVGALTVPTYYVNGLRVSDEKAKSIVPDSISSITVSRATEPGGQQIHIMTLEALGKDGTSLSSRTDNVKLAFVERDNVKSGENLAAGTKSLGDPMFIVDGVAADASVLKTLPRDRIDKIEVLKGPAALKMSTDPRARNGIVMITLKH